MSSPVHRRTSSIHAVLLLPTKHFPSISPSVVARTTLSLLLFQWQYLESFRCLIFFKMLFSSGIPVFSRVHVLFFRSVQRLFVVFTNSCLGFLCCRLWPKKMRLAYLVSLLQWKLACDKIKCVHNLPPHLSYVSTLPDITQKPKIYVFFLSTVWVALKRTSLACKWLWKKPVAWLDHNRCLKWRPFAFKHASSCVCHWSVALSMMPWGIRFQMPILQLINVAFQLLCNVR